MAIGVNIRLPGEAEPNEWIAENSKLVEMKYFFTRKLMLIKESSGFLVLPGGFGTLDECFELLTLLQTGKAEPAPIVFVDSPGERYWHGWEDFVTTQVYGRGFADPVEAALYRITDDLDEAVRGDPRLPPQLPLAPLRATTRWSSGSATRPADLELASLSATFADICSARGIWRTGPYPVERCRPRPPRARPRSRSSSTASTTAGSASSSTRLNALSPPGAATPSRS